jgi:nucleoside phosphorylase
MSQRVVQRVLFVAADPRECLAWVDHWDHVKPLKLGVHWARQGKWKGVDVVAVANGMGGDRASAAIQAVEGVSKVCSIGYCGALEKKLQVGDVFIGNQVTNGAEAWTVKRPGGPAAKSGCVASLDHIVQTAREKSALRAAGSSVVEMEAAGAARAAQALKVPFYCVKVVSDLADEDFANDFNHARLPNGKMNVGRLVMGAMLSPRRKLTELIRLNSRTALASKQLGDFLANCTF